MLKNISKEKEKPFEFTPIQNSLVRIYLKLPHRQ